MIFPNVSSDEHLFEEKKLKIGQSIFLSIRKMPTTDRIFLSLSDISQRTLQIICSDLEIMKDLIHFVVPCFPKCVNRVTLINGMRDDFK